MNLYIGHREYILEATGKSEKLTEKNFSHKHRIISISFDTQNITPSNYSLFLNYFNSMNLNSCFYSIRNC